MRIGVYAGSFNPIHNAHLEIAHKVVRDKLVDKVVFVPAGDKYEKSNLVEGNKRYAMVQLAINNDPNLSVSDIEIINKKLYSYETLNYFKGIYKDDEIYFVMGSDNLNEFHTWKEYKYILNNYGLIVLLRNGQKKDDFKEYRNYENIIFVEFSFDLSSTEIRDNIKNKRYNEVETKIDDKVLKYIKENGLYEQ